MEEVWKPCFQYEGIYEVSNKGNVARVMDDGSRRLLSSENCDMYGHPKVNLKHKGRANVRRICKIVAVAFTGTKEADKVMHLDGNKRNNSVENLISAETNDKLPREITHEFLLERVLYVPETGEFFLRPNVGRPTRGKIRTELSSFGCKKCYNGKMYVQICLLDKQMLGHRVAFFYMTGRWPEEEIDHIDGDGLNNRFSNLRECSRLENCRNVRYRSEKPEEMIGVFRSKKTWLAVAGESRVYCKTKEEAITARKRLLVENGFHDNHGKKKSP